MTNIEVCQDVMNNGFAYIRDTPNVRGSYDLKRTGKTKGWVLLDAFSASAVVAVYNALSEENKTKITRIPILKLINFCFGQVK
jgi:hypothetical protein